MTSVRVLMGSLLLVVGVVAGVHIGNGDPSAAQVSSEPLKIVLLGDSYAAGNGAGAGSYEPPRDCYRSRKAWAARYAAWLQTQGHKVTFVNRACSGGVLRDLSERREMETEVYSVSVSMTEAEAMRWVRENLCVARADEEYAVISDGQSSGQWAIRCTRFLKAQIDAVGRDTDLVLMTGGGNDVNFASIVQECFFPLTRDPGACRAKVEDARAQTQGVEQNLVTALERIRDRLRSDAKVAVVGYPYLANTDDYVLKWKILGVERDSYEASREVRALGREGDAAQLAAVSAANGNAGAGFASFVNVKTLFAGH